VGQPLAQISRIHAGLSRKLGHRHRTFRVTADFRAIKILLDIVRDIERQAEPTAPETSDFSEADEKVLEQIRARFSIGKPEQ
jgi:hypothetical protein